MSISIDKETFFKALAEEGSEKVALIHHFRIRDANAYQNWLNVSNNRFNVKRLHRVKADHAAWQGMRVDEIVIDQFPSSLSAIEFISTFDATLRQVCSEYTVLAIVPEPSFTFHLVKAISWLVRLFKGITDSGTPPSNWKTDNIAVWPDDKQMRVARSQNLNEPLFVYNLNKYKAVADYKNFGKNTRNISGKDAYNRYSRIAGFELLRRGAYPVYGGKPLCLFCSHEDCMLTDHWDHFIFVRYPERRNLLAIIESDEFRQGEIHRNAGLERAAIFMTKRA